MRVISVDPGYDRIGIAILEKNNGKEDLLFSTCVVTTRGAEFRDRLLELTTEFQSIIKEWSPDVCAIEKLFFAKNQKTAMQVSEARGALIDRASQAGLDVYEFTPLEVKTAVCGHGTASKAQVSDMVKRLVKIVHLPKYDDEYDAIAVGLTCLATVK